MKVLFIYSPIQKLELGPQNILIKKGSHAPPLGLLYLGRILEDSGYDVKIIDLLCEDMPDEKLKQNLQSADVVGMTLYSGLSLKLTRELSNKIKEIDSDMSIMVGGPHTCFRPEQALINHNAELCAVREAETTIVPIVEAIAGKRKYSTVPGIYYKEGDTIKHTKPAEQIKDLDSILFPARHLVEHYDYGYVSGIKYSTGKTTSIVSTRGCNHSCKFCGLHYVTPGYRRRSIENLTKEIDEIINEGYETLLFADDNFLQIKKDVEKIMDFIIEKDADIKIWIEQARVDSADRDLYKKMKKAGVDTIYYGIESGNQDILDYYNKRITIAQIEKAVKLSKEMGFIVTGSFIFGSPIETKKHLENTRKFAKKLPLDGAYFYPFNYRIGSPIWDEAVAEGIIDKEEFFLLPNVDRGLGNFTAEWLLKYVDRAYKSFYFNPRFWIREFIRAVTKKDFRILKQTFDIL